MFRILIIAFLTLLIYAVANGDSAEAETVRNYTSELLGKIFDIS